MLDAADLDSRDKRFPVSCALVFSYFVAKPIYLWDSGLPQVADGFMVLLIFQRLMCILQERKSLGRGSPFVPFALLFCYWTVVVNVTAAMLLGGGRSFAIASAMNIYNVLAAVVVFELIVAGGRRVVATIYAGAITSVVIQLLVVLSSSSSGAMRAAGSFNNPNQLAFHGVLVMGVLLVCHDRLGLAAWKTIVGVAVAAVCVSLSLSRSGLAAAMVILVGSFIWTPGGERDRRAFRIFFVLALLAVFFSIMFGEALADNTWMQNLFLRAEKQDAEGFGSGRGYDRIINHPEFWIFGSGEGEVWRFGATNELHSTIGTIQVSYGLVGVGLYAGIVISVLRYNGYRFFYVILGVLTYGLAHNGLRNTVGWLLFALIAAVTSIKYKRTDSSHAA